MSQHEAGCSRVEFTRNQSQVAALLAPESDPGPVAFEVTQSLGCTFAMGLGLSTAAPAFLRWAGKLALQAYSAQVSSPCDRL